MRRLRSRRPSPAPPRPTASIPGDLLLARDPNTAPAALEQIFLRYMGSVEVGSRRPQEQVLRELAKNPNTPPEILRVLSDDYPWEVAQNKALPLLQLEDGNEVLNAKTLIEGKDIPWGSDDPALIPFPEDDENLDDFDEDRGDL